MSLFENSKSYYTENDTYNIFCNAEDFPNKTIEYLKTLLQNKNVIDAGCGTGKYIKHIKERTKSIIGIDKSVNQLQIAKTANPDINFICSNLQYLPVKIQKSYTTIACWVLGTILKEENRRAVLTNLENISENIYLLENKENSEFEYIRGRDKDSRTIQYNNWLIQNGFHIITEVDTYFNFENIAQAQQIFGNIWGKDVITKIKSAKIEHSINIYHKGQ